MYIVLQVAELQKLDGQYKDLINLAITSAEKLVHGKMGKQQYIDSDKANAEKRDDLYQKMENLRTSL